MKLKLISLIISFSIILGAGGYDHGTATGKGNWDISLTWNLFNYFEQGQSYAIIGYGLTEKIDIHAYYSSIEKDIGNYYGGLFYQFLNTKRLDLATAVGIRTFTMDTKKNLFFPQFLYTIRLTNKTKLGGSFVNIINQSLEVREGTTIDIFFIRNIYDSDKIQIDFSLGVFHPVLWKPKYGYWHPTYSIDFKLKKG